MAGLRCSIAYHRVFFSFYYFFSLSSLSSYSLNFRLLLYYIPSIVVPLPLSILCVWRNISILTFCYITPLLHAHSQSIPEYKLTHVLLFFIFNFNFRFTFFIYSFTIYLFAFGALVRRKNDNLASKMCVAVSAKMNEKLHTKARHNELFLMKKERARVRRFKTKRLKNNFESIRWRTIELMWRICNITAY